MLAKEKARRAAVLRNAPRFHGRNTSKFTRTHADHSRGVLVSQAQVSEDTKRNIVHADVGGDSCKVRQGNIA
jgi:cAMP phosphodiesterase